MHRVANHHQYQAQRQEQHQEAPKQEEAPPALPKASPDSKQSPAPKAKADTKTSVVTGKPIASFEERNKRAEKITQKQKEARGETDSPKADKTKKATPGTEKKPETSDSKATGSKDETTAKPGKSSDEQKPETSKSSDASGDSDPVKLKAKLDAAGEALEKADFKALAKLLGKGGKITDVGGEKFAVMSRQRARLTKREQTLDQREAKLEKTRADQVATYGDVVGMKTAYANGQYHVAAKIWEKVTGDSFAVVTQKMARHTSGMSKERLAELEASDAKDRELRQLKAEKEATTRRGQQQATRNQALTNLTSKLDGSDVLLLEDGADLVLREIERAWDRDQSRMMTPAEAAQRVLQREEDKAKRLGYSKGAPPVANDESTDDLPRTVDNSNRRPRADTQAADDTVRRTLAGKVIPSFEHRSALAQRLTERRRGL